MGKQKLKGKDLKSIGYKTDKSKSIAVNIMAKHYKHFKKQEQLELLGKIKENPKKYENDTVLRDLANEFLEAVKKTDYTVYKLADEIKSYKIFGKKFIDQNTILQMDTAMQLQITVGGALMPDAHLGYGLPIGGVLATRNAVIPYGVGMDIACRMALTIYNVPQEYIKRNKYQLKQVLTEKTHFGIGQKQDNPPEHAVLEREEFAMTDLLRQLHGKARMQIGTSGSGNHFVEFGIVELNSDNNLNIPEGNYLALLSHSGSRGLGASIAKHYTKIAVNKCKLPKGAQQLAWLDINSEEGQEYWISMNLAGDFAKASHDIIHNKISKALKLKPMLRIENLHNFAWKELQDDGSELIIHRKGATPAKTGEFGIIPGSMTAPGYIISGKGNPDSLYSASHGAGRKMSRSKARQSYTGSALKKYLKQKSVTLIGGGVDEFPGAYKNIDDVMKGQKDLVNIEGKFYPKIVRMNRD